MSTMPDFPHYKLTLDAEKLYSDYTAFRNATSNEYTYGEKKYRSVDGTDTQYAYLTIEASGTSPLTLIVNLEFYYVYGFLIKERVFAYGADPSKSNPKESEAYKGLIAAGFTIDDKDIIPFGDAYYEISNDTQRDEVADETVTIDAIITSLSRISDLAIHWDDKREDLLRVFWSLVEGVRFSGISRIVSSLLAGKERNCTYGYFYFMAERWAELSTGAAFEGKIDRSIAVYELHRLDIPKRKEK